MAKIGYLLLEAAEHGAVPRVRVLGVNVLESALPQHTLDIDGVVLVGVRLGGLHQREQRRGQVLNHRGLRVVIGHHENAAGLEDPRRLRHQRPRRVLRALVDHERQRHDIHGVVRHLRVLPFSVHPTPALAPRLAQIPVLRNR